MLDRNVAVQITEYSSLWPTMFEAESHILRKAFLPEVVEIEHIGSTAVPGMAAKPVIDMLLGAPSLGLIERQIQALTSHGYRYVPEFEDQLPQRRYFVKPAQGDAQYHLHAVESGSRFWRDHLAFRDILRTDPRVFDSYLTLKRNLAASLKMDRGSYTAAKAPFIEAVIRGQLKGIVIRPIEPNDSLHELTELLHRAYASLGRMGLNYTAVDQSSETTAHRVSRGQCFVAAEGARLVGTIVVEPPDPDSPCEYFAKETVASAHQLAVAPENQRSGLGVSLLDRAEAWARENGFRELAIDTAEPAEHLRSFYKRLGYRQVGFVQWRDKVYRSVVMSKELKHPDEELEIRAIRAEEIEEARGLLTQEPGWASRFQDADEFRRLISRSQRALVAIQSGRIVGFVRAITDDMSNGYLTLLIVQNDRRCKGIGRALVRAVMGENTAMTWVLRADRGAEAFYERIGFVRSKVAMERPRSPS